MNDMDFKVISKRFYTLNISLNPLLLIVKLNCVYPPMDWERGRERERENKTRVKQELIDEDGRKEIKRGHKWKKKRVKMVREIRLYS